jgi:hypothetical protein
MQQQELFAVQKIIVDRISGGRSLEDVRPGLSG